MPVIVSRASWGAAPPDAATNEIGAKPLGVAVHWEGPRVGTRPHDQCGALVQSIQKFHMTTRGWSDVAYSYLVCEHGTIFEGRGLAVGSAANGSLQANKDYYAVCALIGTGDPTPAVLLAGIIDAIALCRTKAGNKVVTHSDLFNTSCPGPELTHWVRSGAADAPPPLPKPPTGKKAAKAPVSVVPPFPGVVSHGSRGAAVSAVQARLKARGWRVVPDGVFGPVTESILRQFQQEKHLVVDGVVGPQTWTALWSDPIT